MGKRQNRGICNYGCKLANVDKNDAEDESGNEMIDNGGIDTRNASDADGSDDSVAQCDVVDGDEPIDQQARRATT